MQVHIHLLSILRDCLPICRDRDRGQGTVDLPEGANLGKLVSLLGIPRRLGLVNGESISSAGWQVLVNGQLEMDLAHRLNEGDRIAILPPMGGG